MVVKRFACRVEPKRVTACGLEVEFETELLQALYYLPMKARKPTHQVATISLNMLHILKRSRHGRARGITGKDFSVHRTIENGQGQ